MHYRQDKTWLVIIIVKIDIADSELGDSTETLREFKLALILDSR